MLSKSCKVFSKLKLLIIFHELKLKILIYRFLHYMFHLSNEMIHINGCIEHCFCNIEAIYLENLEFYLTMRVKW